MIEVFIKVNARQIGYLHIHNIGPNDIADGDTCDYEVEYVAEDYETNFRISHKRKDGAEALVSQCLSMLRRNKVG